MNVDAALDPELRARIFPNARLEGAANMLVFAYTDAASTARNMLKMKAGGLEVGPILMGMGNRAHIVTPSITARGLSEHVGHRGHAGGVLQLIACAWAGESVPAPVRKVAGKVCKFAQLLRAASFIPREFAKICSAMRQILQISAACGAAVSGNSVAPTGVTCRNKTAGFWRRA